MMNATKARSVTGVLRVAGYARVSTAGQASEGTSLDSQLEAIREEAERRGYELVAELREEGVSGAKVDRPSLNKLMQLAEEGQIDAVLLSKVDRLARGRLVDALLEAELQKSGVKLLYIGRDTNTAAGRLLVNIEKDFAEWEREVIKERTSLGKARATREGRIAAGGGAYYTPYAFRYIVGEGRWELVEGEAEIVRLIFTMVGIEGCTTGDVVRRLYELAVPSKRGSDGGKWSRATINGILHNEAYVGRYYWRKRLGVGRSSRRRDRSEWIGPVPVPRIVSDELFEKAQRQLQLNRERSPRNNTRNKYLLRSLVMCSVCGRRYLGTPIGKKYLYYRCGGSTSDHAIGGLERCSARMVRAEVLDRKVWEKVFSLIIQPDFLQSTLQPKDGQENGQKEQSADEAELQALDAAEAVLEREREKLLDLYKRDLIELPELEKSLDGTKKRKAAIAQRRAEIGKREASTNASKSRELSEEEREFLAFTLLVAGDTISRYVNEVPFEVKRQLLEALRLSVEVKGREAVLRGVVSGAINDLYSGPEIGKSAWQAWLDKHPIFIALRTQHPGIIPPFRAHPLGHPLPGVTD